MCPNGRFLTLLCQLQFGADQPTLSVNGLPSCLLLEEALGACLNWGLWQVPRDPTRRRSAANHAHGDDGADKMCTEARGPCWHVRSLFCSLSWWREARCFRYLAERPLCALEQAARLAAAAGAGLQAEVLAIAFLGRRHRWRQ